MQRQTRCSLVFPENPLNENVELPPGKNFPLLEHHLWRDSRRA